MVGCMLHSLGIIFMSLLTAIAQAADTAPAATPADTAPGAIPAKTAVVVRLVSMLSSHDAQTGQKFAFYVAKDVVENGVVVIPACTAGSGTVTLAGKHGINGHEGDLHLRFDTITESDGTAIALDPTEQDFAGKDRKALAFFTTRYLVGDDIEVKPTTDLTVKTAVDASVQPDVAPPACPAPAPSAIPQPTDTP
jgi:hypothetical protein